MAEGPSDSGRPLMQYGLHLMAEGSYDRQPSVGGLERLLRHLAAASGLQAIGQPKVLSSASGWCGIILIAESHASIHLIGSNPPYQMFVDLFSCRAFNAEPVISYLETWGHVRSYKILERGMLAPIWQQPVETTVYDAAEPVKVRQPTAAIGNPPAEGKQ